MADVDLPDPHEAKEDPFAKRVALTTAIFAVVLAFTGLGGSNATKDMMLAQQQASDQWAFYQAKAFREHLYRAQKTRLELDLAERGAAMPAEAKAKYESALKAASDEEGRYAREKKEIETAAKGHEAERDANRVKDPYFDYGEVLLQVAIVMASLAILSSSKRTFWFSLVLAVVGLGLTAAGYLR